MPSLPRGGMAPTRPWFLYVAETTGKLNVARGAPRDTTCPFPAPKAASDPARRRLMNPEAIGRGITAVGGSFARGTTPAMMPGGMGCGDPAPASPHAIRHSTTSEIMPWLPYPSKLPE